VTAFLPPPQRHGSYGTGQTPVYKLTWQSGMGADDYPETGPNAHVSDCERHDEWPIMSNPFLTKAITSQERRRDPHDIQAINGPTRPSICGPASATGTSSVTSFGQISVRCGWVMRYATALR
jgi:hypothetical protein